MTESLTEALLAKPVGPTVAVAPVKPELTKQVEVKAGGIAEVTLNGAEEAIPLDAQRALKDRGLDPTEWMVTGFKSSEWTMPNGETGYSTKYTFGQHTTNAPAERPNLDELIAAIDNWAPTLDPTHGTGEYGFIVALGDMQFGKIDGDGVEGTLRRTIGCIDKAADIMWSYANRFPIGHVHVAFLGDHIEGFQSQGGANVWRTPLTLSEQIRLTRRVMLHALLTFADAAEKVSLTAVPGNHGETTRFAGKGVTRYDDSHDTESLIAVADAAALNPSVFEHVKFYVPETDEMTTTVDVAGTKVMHIHGHQWRPGKHWDWWGDQAFFNANPHAADLLLAGHMHHLVVEQEGPRMFLQVPSLESESTWFKQGKGVPGDPGIVVAITKDGTTTPLEVIR